MADFPGKAMPVVLVPLDLANVKPGPCTPVTIIATGGPANVLPGPATPIMQVIGRPVLKGKNTPVKAVVVIGDGRPTLKGKATPVA